jgi:hypothetical protein
MEVCLSPFRMMCSMPGTSSRPPVQPIRLNQFGASFGGPIRKDKTFFFATWEQTRQLISDTTVSTVPTLMNRAVISRIFAVVRAPRC